MNISYSNYNYASINNKHNIQQTYITSFPKDERFPFYILRACNYDYSTAKLEAILNYDQYIGMQFVVRYDTITYLMYFAIDEAYRNNGYGGQALRSLIIRNDNVLLCIENPTKKKSIAYRRKNFYIRNGMYETGVFIEDTGITYEVLSSEKGFKPDEACLRNRYAKMTTDATLMRIISNTFEMNVKLL